VAPMARSEIASESWFTTRWIDDARRRQSCAPVAQKVNLRCWPRRGTKPHSHWTLCDTLSTWPCPRAP
jgi:hypothetical protein